MKYLILYPDMSRNHACHLEWYLREVVRQHPGSAIYGKGRPGYDKNRPIADVLRETGADVILTAEGKYQGWHNDLAKCDAFRVHILGDYVPFKHQIILGDRILDKDKYHLIFAQTDFELREVAKRNQGEIVAYLPYSVDANWFHRRMLPYSRPGLIRSIDVAFIGNQNRRVYPNRPVVKGFIEDGLPWRLYTDQVFDEDYLLTMCDTKIFLISNSRFKALVIKYWEAMASGAMVLADRPDDLDTDWHRGLIPGVHLVLYDGLDDMRCKIDHYLNHDTERLKVAEAGQKHCLENCTNETRVKQMHKTIMGCIR